MQNRRVVFALAVPMFISFAVRCGESPTVTLAGIQNPAQSALTNAQSGFSGPAVVGSEEASAQLIETGSCPALADSIKAQLQSAVQAETEYNRDMTLAWVDDMENYSGYYGGCGGFPFFAAAATMPSMALVGCGGGAAGDGSDSGPGGGSYSEYSTTNTQELGVDEADFVKNDGSYVYILAGSTLRIFSAWPASETHLISVTELEGIPEEMFVSGDQLVVYATVPRADACIQGYDGNLERISTAVTIFDIQDRTAPTVERELIVDGALVGARRIDEAVYTVIQLPNPLSTAVSTWLDYSDIWSYGVDEEYDAKRKEISEAYAALIDENRATIASASIDDLLPAISDAVYDGGFPTYRDQLIGDCEDFLVPESGGGIGQLLAISISLDDDSGFGMTSIAGGRGEVYASHEGLYIAEDQFIGYWDGEQRTVVHAFDLSGAGVAPEYRGSGRVPGKVINQFAMDEYQGYLRIATTHGVWDERGNALYVLGENTMPDGARILSVMGSISGIAPTEDIRSVRFDDDRGFIVTFKKTDPLFALDLSDPTDPRITGELKIPGFSTYMHFMDDDHLLTIGFDADDQDDFAWFTGLMLQIFDVSNPNQPLLAHKMVIGTRGSESDATSNHLAFNYFPERNLLAIPMAICEAQREEDYWDAQLTFSGLMVFDVTTADGFTELGRVAHESSDYGYSGCGGWWTDPDSAVKRSIIMADATDTYVFSISGERMKVNELGNLSQDLVTEDLPAAPYLNVPYCNDYWGDYYY